MTYEYLSSLTNAQLSERREQLTKILDSYNDEAWDEAYDEYCDICNIMDERYREDNMASFTEFKKTYIDGKDDIDDEIWSFYSDWHKDMYGFRPR